MLMWAPKARAEILVPPPFRPLLRPWLDPSRPPVYEAAIQSGGVFTSAAPTAQPTYNDVYGPSRDDAPEMDLSEQ